MFNVLVNTRSSMLAEDPTTTGNPSANKYAHSPYLCFQLKLEVAVSCFPTFLEAALDI